MQVGGRGSDGRQQRGEQNAYESTVVCLLNSDKTWGVGRVGGKEVTNKEIGQVTITNNTSTLTKHNCDLPDVTINGVSKPLQYHKLKQRTVKIAGHRVVTNTICPSVTWVERYWVSSTGGYLIISSPAAFYGDSAASALRSAVGDHTTTINLFGSLIYISYCTNAVNISQDVNICPSFPYLFNFRGVYHTNARHKPP